jgi:CDGSH-type Zn-finger protein
MSLMRAVNAGRRLPRMPLRAGARTSSFIPSTPEEWQAAGYEISPRNGAPKIYSPWNKWFPYEPVPYSPKLGPYIVKVQKDQVYYWCSCGESLTQPFCDGVGGCGQADAVFKPIPYIPRYDETAWFCGSKHSPRRPTFDGTCWLVWCDVNPIPAAGIGFVVSFVFGIFSTWMVHP